MTPPVTPSPVSRLLVGAAFGQAADWFAATVAGIGDHQWEEPGLGQWTVRHLVGHTGRALITVEEYFRDSCPETETAPARDADDDPVGGAGEYFLGTHGATRLHADVAERGRQAGAELGPVPRSVVADLVTRVGALVRQAPESAVFVTRFGVQPFATYLCTRTVELVVHTVDIGHAVAVEPVIPDDAARLTLAVMMETARRRGAAVEVVRALGGRARLAPGFSLFG
jgi:uncharacterized protein (TIGR03083 family)